MLLSVPRYDFNWQHTCRPTEPKRMPAGTWIPCTGGFDNTRANPANPNPRIPFRWGDQSFDARDGKTITYGGYSNQIVVNEDFVLRVSDKLPLDGVAPLLCAGITTYSPLKTWNVGAGHRVGVLGLGGLGHMAVKLAASFGSEVAVLSRSPGKEADARRLGAHHFLNTTSDEQVKAAIGSFDYIVDTVSAKHDYNLPINLLRTDGTLICVGAPPEPIELDVFPLLFQRRRVVGSLIGGLPETQEMLDYCAKKNITADIELIRMDQINEAYSRMEKSDVKYRFVIDMATL